MAGQVYVHHYVSSTAFLLGSGAELRGQMTRQPVRLHMLALHGVVLRVATRCNALLHVTTHVNIAAPVSFAGTFA